jgi:hypothetical protein
LTEQLENHIEQLMENQCVTSKANYKETHPNVLVIKPKRDSNQAIAVDFELANNNFNGEQYNLVSIIYKKITILRHFVVIK